tara:strand:+ start:163 stop:1272 length:1110 start_codon:yes stop_codon:yes gene_type:complete
MSTLKVGAIRGVSASSDAITVASDGSCTANITNNLSNRNLIINGAMQVAQRGTSNTSGGNGYYTVDRINYYNQGIDNDVTKAQADIASGTTPYSLGFRKSFKLTNGDQSSGAGASDQIQIEYRIEAQDIANSGWNYNSSTSFLTLSFYVKSSVGQVFNFFVKTEDGTEKNMPFSTPSLTADTWTKVAVQIKGDSGISFNNDNGNGLNINFSPFLGTDYTDNSITNGEWIAWNSGTRYKDVTSTWYTTNDATFEITGLQLEVGSVATDFEHRSFSQELQLCQRYYRQQSKSRASGRLGGSVNYVAMVSYPLSPHMRNTPSVAMYGSASYNSNVSTISTVNISSDHIGIMANISDGLYYYYNNGWTADAEL